MRGVELTKGRATQRWWLAWTLAVLAALSLFWLQAFWDKTHPPVYESPWGALDPGKPLTPAAARALEGRP